MARTTYGPITAGARPSFTSERQNWALMSQNWISQAQTSPTPPPKTAPLTSATVGIASRSRRASMAANARASARFSASLASPSRRIQFRSAPALKCCPAPDRTRMRTDVSVSATVRASSSPAIMESSNALRFSGRLRVTRATGPSSSSNTVFSVMITSERRQSALIQPVPAGRCQVRGQARLASPRGR